ncbi:hypothetical protein HCN44_001468 [Aphidius gifuensis]|uniref:28S ribosomal protein S17, mitochondrial n=1 Tax=Aphidius gifuensis TaxID=684658 RepID=A0A834XRK0_APHGI|nr:28S ribosomal protein S17, mitochondrial [Aphidius gifuensis]KAF7992143.1 hypothetical protein HCN44_001468 [Aphidius gifuensis]
MAAANAGKQTLRYLLGQCMPSVKENAVKIRIKKLGLDERLLMYFNEYEFVYAHDPNKICKPGDVVLIQNLPEKITRLITHKVVEMVHPLGDVTCPLTNKPVVVGQYRDDIELMEEVHGPSENRFEYKKQLPRGTQEDKRDYSHREPFVKYHDDPNDPQPHAI